MALASKWLDLVVGLDLHLEITPVGPLPFPHPFIGLVGDPAAPLLEEIAAAIGDAPPQPGMVTIGGFRATVTGDTASMPVPHIVIPPGLAWAPVPRLPSPPIGLRGKVSLPDPPLPPPSRASLLLGSQTVKMMGANTVRTGELALSCSEPVALPTSQVLSMGMPMPVLVGGPPGIDWQQAVASAGTRAQRTTFTKSIVADKIVPEAFARARSILPAAERVVTGHPVAVTTGSVLAHAIDFALPGPIPLRFERHYDSNWCDRESPVGRGWSHSLDVALWIEEHAIVLRTGDGRELEFSQRRGGAAWHEIDKLELRSVGERRWEIWRPDGVVLELGPVPGDARDRGLARLQRMRTLDGHAVQLHYDASARLSTVVDAAGRTIHFEHDARGRLVAIGLPSADGEGMQVHAAMRYSDAGELVEVRDAAGQATRYAYDRHLLVAETDRNGVAFHFRYDGFGPRARCVETWGVDGEATIHHHVIDYDRRNRRSIVTTSLGAIEVYAYDGAFMVTEVIDPRGGTTVLERDRAHRVVARTDPMGRRTAWTYDARGDVVQLEEPGGRVTQWRRDEHGRVVWERTPAGFERTQTWDRHGRLVAEVDASGHRTEHVYQGGRRIAIVDAAGQRTSLEHDSAGNIVGVVTPLGARWSWTYDALGRMVTQTDPVGAVTRWARDALGRAVAAHLPDGNVVERVLDPEGHVLRERDRSHDVTFARRGLGWLAAQTIGTATVRFEHDAEGRVVAVVDAAGQRHVRELDLAGAVRREVGFDGGAVAFDRDALGRVTRVRRASGRATAVRWDEAGRVDRIDHDGGPAIAYAWREDGALVRASCGDVVVEIERDASGRATRETCGDAWVASRWGHLGVRSSFESSRGAVVEVVRNAVGDCERVVARDGTHRWECTLGRDASGREIDRRLPGGVRAPVAPTRESASAPGRHLDAAGNVFSDASLSDRTYAGARLESMGGVVYRYDADGRRIERAHPDGRVWQYHWDAADRLVQVDRPDGTAVAFEYDALGRRVRRNAAGRVTRWSWDGDVPLHEWCEQAEPPEPRDPPAQASRRAARLAAKTMLVRARGSAGEAEFLAALRKDAPRDPVAARLLAEHVDGPAPVPAPTEAITWVFAPETFAPMCRLGETTAARSIVTDDLGVPTCLVDGAGEVVWSSEIDVHGRVTGDPHACPFRFPGQYDDREVDLSYNRHRWYDADTGAYLSPDPLGLYGGLAAYAYVADPFAQSDPLGLAACTPAEPIGDLRSPVAFPEPPDPLARARPHRGSPREDLSVAAAVAGRTHLLDR